MSAHEVRFGTLHADGSMTDERTIKQSDLAKCPYCIWMAEHYREDGSCRCDDPDHSEMREWGYRWNGERWTA